MASLRAAGPLRLGGDLRLSVAGAESNVAIGAARLGCQAAWVGVVGADELGALVLRTLRAEGVNTASTRVDPAAPTGLMLVEARLAEVSRITYFRSGSAGSTLGAADVAAAIAALSPDVVHLTGITPALGPGPRQAVHEAVAAAGAAGIPVCFDVNYRSALWAPAEAGAELAPLAAKASIVIASEAEVGLVSGVAGDRNEADHVGALLEAGVGEVVVTRGAAGATAYTAGGRFHQPALAVTVADTVGAGDAFVAGYLSALLDGEGVAGRSSRAARTAAFAVACRGDWEGLPTRAELALLDAPPGTAVR